MKVREPLSVPDRHGRRNVFAIGPAGDVVRRAPVGDRGNWTEWQSLGGFVKTYTVLADAAGALHVFAVGKDDAVWTCAQRGEGEAFAAWHSFGGGRVRSVRAARNHDGRIELFACGFDDALWNNAQLESGGEWTGWVTLGGRIGNVHVEPDAERRLHVFGIGGDAALWYIHQLTPGGRYAPWKSLGGRVLDLAAGDNRDGLLEVFAIGTDRAVWVIQQQGPNRPWGEWRSLGGIVKELAVGSTLDGRLEVFGIGADDAVWNLAQVAAGSAWSSWQSLGGAGITELHAASDAAGMITVFALSRDNVLYSATQPDPAHDAWTPFARFPQNPAGPSPDAAVRASQTGRAVLAETVVPAVPAPRPAIPVAATGVAGAGRAAARPVDNLADGQVFARDFRVARLLGKGGMGAVYVAEQLSTGQSRALKLMIPALLDDPRNRARFVDEARVPSRIASDHVVETVAAGVDDATDTPWLAMELLDGESLEAAVAHAGGLSHAHARELFAQLGHALGAAHAAGVVHRDLKPENLYLCRPRHRGVPFTLKVLDFGIAALISDTRDAARVTTAVGTPLWMSPEQGTVGASLTPAVDVWAFGLIAFHALTGKEFWLGAHDDEAALLEVLREVFVDAIPPASERAERFGRVAALPAGFDAWFARCVAREPSARFASGDAAAAALDPLLATAT